MSGRASESEASEEGLRFKDFHDIDQPALLSRNQARYH